ncbi:MAG TPA: AraC family transcriptional regulator [Steroidobacteraceae bacterium]|nr:AraC family transcriptional regulator [Steroidobacteraceae bacterium]
MRTHTAAGRGYILATWFKAIGRALDAAGCDGAAILAQAGFELADLDGPTVRCPLINNERLWELALEATADPAFGLKVASQIKHTTFHALSYGLTASSTLKEAFERVQRYCHVASNAVAYELLRQGADYHFVIKPIAPVAFEAVDALVAAQLRMCRSLIGRDFSPLLVELRRPRPARLEDFERLLRAPLRFGAAQNRLILDAQSMERPLEGGNPELARHNDVIALRYLTRIEREDIEARVREVLMQRLEGREPSQEEVAEQLYMSPRTLQRKLGERGTTYKQLLDETRHALALAYLSAPQHSVNEVTYLLGFSSGSCFTRAFRRWTGQSPSDWRAGGAAGARAAPLRAAAPSGAVAATRWR